MTVAVYSVLRGKRKSDSSQLAETFRRLSKRAIKKKEEEEEGKRETTREIETEMSATCAPFAFRANALDNLPLKVKLESFQHYWKRCSTLIHVA